MQANGVNIGRALRLTSVTWIVAGWALAPQSALAEDAFCQVETVYGLAEIVTDEARSPLKNGSNIAVQDRVETSDDSRVTLLCPDDLRISIGPASEVVLAKVEDASTGWAAVLPRGIARFARPLFGEARFEVRTPSAVASVRSTVWIVDVAEGRDSRFCRRRAVSR